MKYLDFDGVKRFRELILNEVKTSVLPAGSIIAYSGTDIPDGYLLCDGSELDSSVYSDLYAAIGTTYGGGDTEDGTFCLPDLNDRTLWGSSAAGEVLEAGLPEIYGMQHLVCAFSGMSYEGAFTRTNESAGITGVSSGSSYNSGWGQTSWYFNASNYNDIYSASDTVQPPALTTLFCIKY